ncbi:alpha/beta hydrolase fold domain-containing protein [Maritimibacter sp. DP07]|uniref:Alpha/beta hydrolase fold domain-containing protein n=1 Tax=Maritimibacter harenae TaxID=2606218 RepID=A0A845LXD0_9RHOB|nr:alpha/beta hydrolase [Maritimibacter harenae]MZR12445.1 alpha/beta hydrolase fold domain-containing protein [Maritimibacter harenae]
MSLRLSLLSALSRATVKPLLARAADPEANRRMLELGARRLFRAPPYALYCPGRIGAGGLWISARPGSHPVRRGKLVLYIHGGGFIAGSPETHAAMLARIAWLTGVEIYAARYRLSPAHRFPDAVEDVRAAWDDLRARGYHPGDIVLGGDSAGGNLALGLLAALCAEGTPPAGLFTLSPLTDFTFSGASIRDNARADPMLPASRAQDVVRWYLGEADPRDPRASPLFADFPGAPPVLFQYAEDEILRDDSMRMAAHLRAAGAQVTEQVWPRAPHVFQIFDGWVPESRDALRGVADFVKARLV